MYNQIKMKNKWENSEWDYLKEDLPNHILIWIMFGLISIVPAAIWKFTTGSWGGSDNDAWWTTLFIAAWGFAFVWVGCTLSELSMFFGVG